MRIISITIFKVNMKTFKSIKEIEAGIRAQITTRPEQAKKAMLKILANQTEDEKSAESTHHHNLMGFTQGDAHILCSFAKQYKEKGWLSQKQTNLLMKKIGKYAGQLTKFAIADKVYMKQGNVYVVNA